MLVDYWVLHIQSQEDTRTIGEQICSWISYKYQPQYKHEHDNPGKRQHFVRIRRRNGLKFVEPETLSIDTLKLLRFPNSRIRRFLAVLTHFSLERWKSVWCNSACDEIFSLYEDWQNEVCRKSFLLFAFYIRFVWLVGLLRMLRIPYPAITKSQRDHEPCHVVFFSGWDCCH